MEQELPPATRTLAQALLPIGLPALFATLYGVRVFWWEKAGLEPLLVAGVLGSLLAPIAATGLGRALGWSLRAQTVLAVASALPFLLLQPRAEWEEAQRYPFKVARWAAPAIGLLLPVALDSRERDRPKTS